MEMLQMIERATQPTSAGQLSLATSRHMNKNITRIVNADQCHS